VKKVLVTGARGFIGRHTIAPLVARGYEVHAVSSQAGTFDAAATWHACDLHDVAASAALVGTVQPSHLLHLAWFAEPGAFWNSGQNIRWVEATAGLVQAFAQHGGRRFVGAGSCAEYAWTGEVCDEETTKMQPATLYGGCKFAAWTILQAFARTAHFSAAWGRVFFLYGPGEKPGRLVSDVVAALVVGSEVALSEGHQRRDFMHVADVGAAFAALLDSAVEGPVNIATGQAPSVRDVATTLARLAGRPDLLRFGARPERPGEPAEIRAAVRRLSGEVGFTPRYTLDAGLKTCLAAAPSAA
jgi:nucleoside-diphosphate-sugar epimerase